MGKAQVLDFTNVKERGAFSKTHKPEGDYLAKVTKVESTKSKKDDGKMWVFHVALTSQTSATYPYHCKLQENQLWKIRNLLVAAGLNVPKKKVAVDPEKVVGKIIGVSLEDSEYEGRTQSEIAAIFPASDLQGAEGPTDEDEDEEEEEEEDTEEEEEEEDEEEKPAPKKKSKKSKKTADVDDDELEEIEIEDI